MFSDRSQAYSDKLVDLWEYRGNRDYELDDIVLLKVGRHIRPNSRFKLIVGREQGENNFLEGYRQQFTSLEPVSHMGPLALLDGQPEQADLTLAARLLARYSQGRDADQVKVRIFRPGEDAIEQDVTPLPTNSIPGEWFV